MADFWLRLAVRHLHFRALCNDNHDDDVADVVRASAPSSALSAA